MIPEFWAGYTPRRQVGLGVAKLTHEATWQLSLFEDEKMDYYRQWDREYDEKMAAEENKRHRSRGKEQVLTFSYTQGEEALRAAKEAIRTKRGAMFSRLTPEDGTDGFEVKDASGKAVERHLVQTVDLKT